MFTCGCKCVTVCVCACRCVRMRVCRSTQSIFMKLEKHTHISVLISTHIQSWEGSDKSKNVQNWGLSSHKLASEERYSLQIILWGHGIDIFEEFHSSATVKIIAAEFKRILDCDRIWPSARSSRKLNYWWISWSQSLYGLIWQTSYSQDVI